MNIYTYLKNINNYFVIINFLDGHYVAYCRNECDKNWYEFDDTIVTRVNPLEVMNRDSYVLFYQKKTLSSINDYRKKCKKLFCQSINKVIYNILFLK